MGWLFAVARGMQERSRCGAAAVVAADRRRPPGLGGDRRGGGVGHRVGGGRATWSAIVGGLVLVGFGLWRLLSERHFRWAGMRLSPAQLAGWSFLMSSAHGAGLMLLPVLATDARSARTWPGTPRMAAPPGRRGTPGRGPGRAWPRPGVHTVAMFAVMAACALLVYEFVGVNVLRRAWFNVDRLWAAVMVGAGALTIALTAEACPAERSGQARGLSGAAGPRAAAPPPRRTGSAPAISLPPRLNSIAVAAPISAMSGDRSVCPSAVRPGPYCVWKAGSAWMPARVALRRARRRHRLRQGHAQVDPVDQDLQHGGDDRGAAGRAQRPGTACRP